MTGRSSSLDAVIVGAGPNGLAAGITLARAGYSVKIFEAKDTVGGGSRSAEMTRPGFAHDICSAVHPMAVASPFFSSINLQQFGLEWLYPDISVAHPLDNESAAVLFDRQNEFSNLGADGRVWQTIFGPWIRMGESFFADMLRPLSFSFHHPFALARFGAMAMLPATTFAKHYFQSAGAQALYGGLAAHSFLSLKRTFSGTTGLALGLAASVGGWPIARGGSQQIANALQRCFESFGGQTEVDAHISSVADLPQAKAILLDVSARQLAGLLDDTMSARFRQKLAGFKPGHAVFKIDWALSQPVPWSDPLCRKAGTLHLGGTLAEMVVSEEAVEKGTVSEKPFVLISQPSILDPSRAPGGMHTLWGYCHVPLGFTGDMTGRIEDQIERFAPGFRECILAKKITSPADFETHNSSYVRGDISGGAISWPQIFRRPVSWFAPYQLPTENMFLCSSSTPPGPGVHGMCGYFAAQAALKFLQR